MPTSRRVFLKYSTVAGVNTVALMHGVECWARWQSAQIEHGETDGVIQKLLKGEGAQVSEQIELKLPQKQTNAALVPVSVETSLLEVKAISILVDRPVEPLAASFSFPNGEVTRVATRLKLSQSSRVWALVNAGEQFFISNGSVTLNAFQLDKAG